MRVSARMFIGAVALGVLGACTGTAEQPGTSSQAGPVFGTPQLTQVGRYRVGVAFEPDPPPMGELFTATATVMLPDGTPLETGVVTLDARMPQHDHGMETRPRVREGDCDPEGACRHPDGVYVADGFKFHMSGDWTVLLTVDGPRGPDSTSFVFRMP
jgi:hypothetical protein